MAGCLPTVDKQVFVPPIIRLASWLASYVPIPTNTTASTALADKREQSQQYRRRERVHHDLGIFRRAIEPATIICCKINGTDIHGTCSASFVYDSIVLVLQLWTRKQVEKYLMYRLTWNKQKKNCAQENIKNDQIFYDDLFVSRKRLRKAEVTMMMNVEEEWILIIMWAWIKEKNIDSIRGANP